MGPTPLFGERCLCPAPTHFCPHMWCVCQDVLFKHHTVEGRPVSMEEVYELYWQKKPYDQAGKMTNGFIEVIACHVYSK